MTNFFFLWITDGCTSNVRSTLHPLTTTWQRKHRSSLIVPICSGLFPYCHRPHYWLKPEMSLSCVLSSSYTPCHVYSDCTPPTCYWDTTSATRRGCVGTTRPGPSNTPGSSRSTTCRSSVCGCTFSYLHSGGGRCTEDAAYVEGCGGKDPVTFGWPRG